MVECRIIKYETGWDHGIEQVEARPYPDDVLLVESHAPSRIELCALAEGTIRITAGLHREGSDAAQMHLHLPDHHRQTVRIGESVDVHVRLNQCVALECEVVDKSRCWNYWMLSGVLLRPPARIVLDCSKPLHLGDALAILCGLQGFAQENTVTAAVTGQLVLRDLLDALEFPDVQFVDEPATLDAATFYWALPWHEFWLRRFQKGLAHRVGGHYGGGFFRPKPRRELYHGPKDDVVLCQFDTRSSARAEPRQLLNVLRALFPGRRLAAIGGLDTPQYLGSDFEYRTGDLHFILDQLARCSHFIGADSGMAHLAGVLGVRSTVINLMDFHIIHLFFREYPDTRVLDRQRLFELLESGLPCVD